MFLFGFIDYISNTSVSYCVACAPVREDDPRALESGLFSVYTYKPYNIFIAQ